jgi:ribosomal protein S18 acetylase RimI-like enzyme
MVIDVREARHADAHAIAEAHIEGWRVGYRHLLPDEFLDSDDFADVRQRGWQAWTWADWAPGSVLFVGALDGDVVGFGHAGPRREEPDVGEVFGFYLHPRAWGSGVADVLMARCVDHLVAEGFPRAVLWVLRDNPRARGFYERTGWQPTGRDEWFTGVYGRTLPEPLAEVEYGRPLP